MSQRQASAIYDLWQGWSRGLHRFVFCPRQGDSRPMGEPFCKYGSVATLLQLAEPLYLQAAHVEPGRVLAFPAERHTDLPRRLLCPAVVVRIDLPTTSTALHLCGMEWRLDQAGAIDPPSGHARTRANRAAACTSVRLPCEPRR